MPESASATSSRTAYAVRALRILRLALHLAHGASLAALVYPRCSRERQQALIQGWSRRLLAILHIKLRCHDRPRELPKRSVLIANHVSWIDIFAINALFPAIFVAKAELRGWPIVGRLSERTGTIFLERDSARAARRANREIARALLEGGRPVVIYPEGTTTRGAELRPFRPALLQPAVDSAALVHPLALRYVDRLGARSDAVAWVGDASLIESILSIVGQAEISIELRFLAAWSGAGHSRGELAARARSAIAQALGLPQEASPWWAQSVCAKRPASRDARSNATVMKA